MELIERYLYDVGRRLPAKQRQEVVDELRTSIYDALEDAHESEGISRPAAQGFNEELVVGELQGLGSPQEVAASYFPQSRYLIGPQHYDQFRQTVTWVFSSLGAVFFVLFCITLWAQPLEPGQFAGRLAGWGWELLDTSIFVFALLVLIFAAIQRLEWDEDSAPESAAFEGKALWDPRDLPAIGDLEEVNRFGAITSAVADLVLLGLLARLVYQLPELIPESLSTLASSTLLTPLPWLVAALGLGFLFHLVLALRGKWHRGLRLAHLAVDLVALYALWQVVQGFLAHSGDLAAVGFSENAIRVANGNAWMVLVIFSAILVWENVKHLRYLFGGAPAKGSSVQVAGS
ncbi:MAG: hypothetical protein AAGD01_03380 [Acidobacteriota bacterium]